MGSEGLEEMVEGDSADMCAAKFHLMLLMGGMSGGSSKDPIGMSRKFFFLLSFFLSFFIL
jgi:hypothetical protein